MSRQRRWQRTYDHGRWELVRESGDLGVATSLPVPRSTAVGWLRARPQDVITLDGLDPKKTKLQAEVLRLRRRIRVLGSTNQLAAPQLSQLEYLGQAGRAPWLFRT